MPDAERGICTRIRETFQPGPSSTRSVSYSATGASSFAFDSASFQMAVSPAARDTRARYALVPVSLVSVGDFMSRHLHAVLSS